MTAQSNVVSFNPASFTGHQLELIRRTVASDCNSGEFDLFVAAAQRAGLDPFRKQISALVFNKSKPDKRRMAIVTTIEGLRVIADRSRAYRPDEDEAAYEIDPEQKSPTNPLGLVKAKVRIFKNDRPVAGVAYWDEFAPISDEWKEGDDGKRRPTGKKTLDTGGNWGRMPRLMLAKCAEAQALRKAFPEDLSGLYEGAELDQAVASEILGQHQEAERLAKVGGSGVTLQLFPNAPLEAVPLGKVADAVIEAMEGWTFEQQRWFESANTHPLREFWARAPGDALELKKRLEANRAKLEAALPGVAG